MTEQSPRSDTASRVRATLQLVGGAIALVQGAVLPLLGLPFSVPIFLGAVGMAGFVAPAISIDAKRRAKAQDSGS